MPQHGYESVLSIILTCVAAETSSRFGSFYRGSYSPQPRGQRRSCCRSAWHTFCTYKAQWGRHTQTDQGKSLCLMWTFYAEIIYLFIFNVCVCRKWQQRWVELWLKVIPTVSWVQLSNFASHSETWVHYKKAAGSTMRWESRNAGKVFK